MNELPPEFYEIPQLVIDEHIRCAAAFNAAPTSREALANWQQAAQNRTLAEDKLRAGAILSFQCKCPAQLSDDGLVKALTHLRKCGGSAEVIRGCRILAAECRHRSIQVQP